MTRAATWNSQLSSSTEPARWRDCLRERRPQLGLEWTEVDDRETLAEAGERGRRIELIEVAVDDLLEGAP